MMLLDLKMHSTLNNWTRPRSNTAKTKRSKIAHKQGNSSTGKNLLVLFTSNLTSDLCGCFCADNPCPLSETSPLHQVTIQAGWVDVWRMMVPTHQLCWVPFSPAHSHIYLTALCFWTNAWFFFHILSGWLSFCCSAVLFLFNPYPARSPSYLHWSRVLFSSSSGLAQCECCSGRPCWKSLLKHNRIENALCLRLCKEYTFNSN